MNLQGVHYATLQRTTLTARTPPRHQPGALGVLAPRALLAAKDAFQVLPYVQLLKTRALHCGCPVEGLLHGPHLPCAFSPKKRLFPRDSLLPALSTNTCVSPFSLRFWHRPLWYNLQSTAWGSPPICQLPFLCWRGCNRSSPSLIAAAALDSLLGETSLEGQAQSDLALCSVTRTENRTSSRQ